MTRSSLRLNQDVKLDILAATPVTLLPLAYFNAALRGIITLASEDGVLFNVPLRVAAANIVRDGSLPLWNPYLFSGMPLHGAAQGGLLFPLNWFYLFFDTPIATNLMALSTYMLAALGAYLYARRSGSSVLGAVVTSLVWQWCGFLIGQFTHVNIVQTAALLPWLLWSVDGYGIRGDRKWGLVLAVVVMLQGFTGHQQTLVYSLLLAAAYAVVMWRASGSKRNAYLSSLVLLGAGMLLAAVQILPTYELMRNSMRSHASFQFFTDFSLPPRFLLTFFAPYLMGGGDGRLFRVNYFGAPFYGEFIGYVGLVALILAALSIALKRDARTKFWAAVVVIAFMLSLGRHWPFKLYGIIYYLPILNLFRVPARHMMEVDMALSVLAGRGITALAAATDRKRATRLSLVIGAAVFLLTCLVVTLGRPTAFRLARDVPVTLLRAPELFLPITLAALSMWAVWKYARTRSVGSVCLIIAVVALDLCLWGQSSGWRVSGPPPDSPIWHEPPAIQYLSERKPEPHSYRILTVPHAFDPKQTAVGPMTSRSTAWVFWLQPDIYMRHGIENAAGYDGFGMARYSRLVGDMTVWGELPNPDQTLRGEGRELDLLNVRYLLAMTSSAAANETTSEQAPLAAQSINTPSPTSAPSPASRVFGKQHFPTEDLKLPSIDKRAWLTFELPPFEADRIALLTNLSWSLELTDKTPVARLSLRTQDGRRFDFDLRVGEHTSEWSYDRPDIRRQIKHKRAQVATSYAVRDSQARYQGHTYISTFKLPERAVITGGEITVHSLEAAPDLSLTVHNVLLANDNDNSSVALRTEWFSRQVAAGSDGSTKSSGRWLKVVDVNDVQVFENTRALPRAWLASSHVVLKENEILQVIRTGSFANGNLWEPRRTALMEAPININTDASEASEDSSATTTVTSHEPNRVELRTTSTAPSILVLSENFFPGWVAYVDGNSTEMLRVNYNLRGVVLAEGQHVVEFVYRPGSVFIGLAISILTLAALVLWVVARQCLTLKVSK